MLAGQAPMWQVHDSAFLLGWRFFPESAAVEAVPQEIEQEQGIVFEIARGEAAGLGAEAEEPGQPGPLHPGGGVGFKTGVDVESKAHRQHNAAMDFALVLVNPSLLLGRAQSQPNEVRRKAIDFRNDFRVLLRLKVAVMRADNFNVGIALQKKFLEALDAQVRAAEKIMGEGSGTVQDAFTHEDGAVHAVAHFGPLQVKAPGERHGIGNKVIKPAGDFSKGRVMAAQRDDMRVGEVNGKGFWRARLFLEVGGKSGVAGRLQPCPQNAKSIHQFKVAEIIYGRRREETNIYGKKEMRHEPPKG